MSAMTLVHTNGHAAGVKAQTWLQASVQEFFTAFNWEDQPPEMQELQQSVLEGTDTPLRLNLSVSQFFGAIPWDGASIGAPAVVTPPPTTSAPVVDSFTLDDFSSLF